jgi:hypothetical protein
VYRVIHIKADTSVRSTHPLKMRCNNFNSLHHLVQRVRKVMVMEIGQWRMILVLLVVVFLLLPVVSPFHRKVERG